MQVAGGRRGLKKVEGEVPPLDDAVSLGRWRLAGEICDGKCLAGAMRPGRGLAHKACANLCLIGDIPPVFVSSKPVEGSEFLMVAGPDGGRMPDRAYDLVGQYIELKGEIERRGRSTDPAHGCRDDGGGRMIRHVFMLAVVILVGAILLYLSRFWIFSWWGRDGLFGVEALRPQGDLIARWLRGTDFRPFELLSLGHGRFSGPDLGAETRRLADTRQHKHRGA